MAKFGTHYAEGKKPIVKGHVVYNSVSMKCPEWANPETGSRRGAMGMGEEE